MRSIYSEIDGGENVNLGFVLRKIETMYIVNFFKWLCWHFPDFSWKESAVTKVRWDWKEKSPLLPFDRCSPIFRHIIKCVLRGGRDRIWAWVPVLRPPNRFHISDSCSGSKWNSRWLWEFEKSTMRCTSWVPQRVTGICSLMRLVDATKSRSMAYQRAIGLPFFARYPCSSCSS